MSSASQSRSSSSSFHFFAGLSSGIFSAVLLQPADLLKTRVQQSGSSSLLQTVRVIANSPQPIRGLWRGTVPSALRTGIGSALYFSSLNALRRYVATSRIFVPSGTMANAGPHSSSALPKLSNLGNMLTGAVARASVGMVMMPITVIKVRYESNFYAYKSLLGASSDILRREGLRGFFAGFGATAIRDAPYAGLYVLFYEQSKKRMSHLAQRAPGANLARSEGMKMRTSASINFLSGVLAAGIATAITNPFDAIKTRIQLTPSKYGNMLQAVKLMIKEDGARSLLDGLGLRMGRKVVSSALAWTLYEELIRRAEVRWLDNAETM